jgi:hypothetical protein
MKYATGCRVCMVLPKLAYYCTAEKNPPNCGKENSTMKKWLLGLIIVLILAVAGTYMVIPAVVKVQKVVIVAASDKGIAPLIHDAAGMARWWGDKTDKVPDTFFYNHAQYYVTKPLLAGCGLSSVAGSDTLNMQLYSVALNADSAQVIWGTSLPATNNPVKRLQYYWRGLRIKSDMESILGRLQNFAANMENVYGIKINHAIVQDTLLLATEYEGTGKPTNDLVYTMIDKATAYLKGQGAEVTNPPLLSIITKDSIHYKTMVALPINKEIAASPNFFIRRMFAGNILITEVKGGPAKVAKAFAQLEHYRLVQSMTSPAKPFETLVTNRMAEPDSNKWVTKIYYPVF